MEDGEGVVEQILHAEAQAVQVVLRRVRQVGASLLPTAIESQTFFTEPGRYARSTAIH